MTHRKTFNYKGVRVNAFGIPVLIESHKKQGDSTRKRVRDLYNISFVSPLKSNAPKNLIVMYDIPHNQKKERDWFRRHLIKFGYIMIQKSVWVGPSPLPKEFLEYTKEIKIGSNFKTFKLAKPYNSKASLIK
jgi:CRISPR-associated endonuclease Cas2